MARFLIALALALPVIAVPVGTEPESVDVLNPANYLLLPPSLNVSLDAMLDPLANTTGSAAVLDAADAFADISSYVLPHIFEAGDLDEDADEPVLRSRGIISWVGKQASKAKAGLKKLTSNGNQTPNNGTMTNSTTDLLVKPKVRPTKNPSVLHEHLIDIIARIVRHSPVGVTVRTFTKMLKSIGTRIAVRAHVPINENGLMTTLPSSNAPLNMAGPMGTSPCADVALLFARATAEPGNVGLLVGPALIAAVRERLPYVLGAGASLAVQGINYKAGVVGYLRGGDSKGAETVAELVRGTSTRCPNTRIVLAGYAQGAMVMHRAVRMLSKNNTTSTATAPISAALLIADPRNGQALPGIDVDRTLVICHRYDSICHGKDRITGAHLTYAHHVGPAADFILSTVAADLAKANSTAPTTTA